MTDLKMMDNLNDSNPKGVTPTSANSVDYQNKLKINKLIVKKVVSLNQMVKSLRNERFTLHGQK